MKPEVFKTIEDFIGPQGYVEAEASIFLGFGKGTPLDIQRRILAAMKVPEIDHERYIAALTPEFRAEVERRVKAEAGTEGRTFQMKDTYYEAVPSPHLIKPSDIKKNILVADDADTNTVNLKIRDIKNGGWIKGVPFHVDSRLVPAGDATYHITTMQAIMKEHIRLAHIAYGISLEQLTLNTLIAKGKATYDQIREKERYDGQFRKVMDAAHDIKSRGRVYFSGENSVVSVKLRAYEHDVQINAELQGYLPSEHIGAFFRAAGMDTSGKKKKVRTAYRLPIGKVEMVQIPLHDPEGKVAAIRHVLECEREVKYCGLGVHAAGILGTVANLVPWDGKTTRSVSEGGLSEKYGHVSLQRRFLDTWR